MLAESFKPVGCCSFKGCFTLEITGLWAQTDTYIHIQMKCDAQLSGITKGPRGECAAEPICSVGENYKTSPQRVLDVNYFIISYCLFNLKCRHFLHEMGSRTVCCALLSNWEIIEYRKK